MVEPEALINYSQSTKTSYSGGAIKWVSFELVFVRLCRVCCACFKFRSAYVCARKLESETQIGTSIWTENRSIFL